ncbi:MAG: sigma-70 family RNA polymerase sigma factor [Bacteroidota bacterium]|nr:sigma-70 family RNA polymerase sigma factor [Bacteroidota bacterium]
MADLTPFSDNELVSKYKETKDKALIGALFQRHTHLVFGVCMKYLKDEENCKDAVMMIFEKLINDLLKHDITHFKTWLYTVSKNYCLSLLRTESSKRDKLKEITPIQNEFMESDHSLHLNGENENENKLVLLESGIQLLNIEQKSCIELFYIKEKCYNEVASITGYSLNEVKSYIQNGKRNLKNYLINKNEH